jgi:hypothetical protein
LRQAEWHCFSTTQGTGSSTPARRRGAYKYRE